MPVAFGAYNTFKENTQYTLTIKGHDTGDGTNTGLQIGFIYTDGSTWTRVSLAGTSEQTKTVTSKAGKTVKGLGLSYGHQRINYIDYIQLEEGTTATEYEPYHLITSSTTVTKTENHELTAQWRDATAPTITANDITYGETLSATIVDNESGVRWWQVNKNATEPTGGWSSVQALQSRTVTKSNLDAGTWYIWAKDQEGNVSSKQITVNKAANPITVTNPDIQYTGATVNLASYVADAQGTVTYSIKTNGTTTSSSLSGSNLTLGAMNASNDNNQTVVVTVTAAGNANYEADSSKDITVTVQKHTLEIEFTSAVPSSMYYNQVVNAEVQIVENSQTGGTSTALTNATFASGSTSVITATGANNKVITAVAASGSSVITATLPCSTTVKQATVTKTITTTKADIAPSPTVTMTGYVYGGTKTEPSISSNIGGGTPAYYYNTTGSTTGGTPWSEVTSSTSLPAGDYYIYAVIPETTNYNGFTTEPIQFTITPAGEQLALSCTETTAKTGATINIEDYVTSHQGALSYEITNNGTTTASSLSGSNLTLGAMSDVDDNDQTVVVTITAAATGNYTQDSKTITITVEKHTRIIAIASSVPSSLPYQGTATAAITISGSGGTANNASSATYATSNEEVITVNGTTLTAVASSGSAIISATLPRTTTVKEVTTTGATSKTITATKATMSPAPTVSMTGYKYGGTKSTPSVNDNIGGGTPVYYYNTSNSNSGGTEWSTVADATALNAGTYWMYAEIPETTNYNAYTTAVTQFTIERGDVVLSDIPTELQYVGKDMEKTISATAPIAGNWTVTSGDGNVTISSGASTTNDTTGTFNIRGETASETASTITVSFTPTSSNYAATTEAFTAKVTDLSLSSASGTIILGNGNLTPTISSTNAGTITVDTSATGYNASIATASISGNTLTITPVSVGTATITIKETNVNKTATFTATITVANYSVSSGSPTYHTTLATAYAACDEGGTITVEADNEDSSTVTIDKDITLNTGAAKTITRTATITVNNGKTLEISGTGKITSSSNIKVITNNGTFSMATNATIENTNSYRASAAIANSGAVTISNGTVVGAYVGIDNSVTYTATSTVNISGGLVKATNTIGSSGIYNRGTNTANPHTVTITGGTVGATDGDYYGIYNTGVAATTTVTGGTVYGYNRAIYNLENAITNVGDTTTTLSTSAPLISGGTYGIYNESGYWYFYNGKIQGTLQAYYGNYSGIRTGCIVQNGTEDSYKTAILESDIDPTGYTELGTVNTTYSSDFGKIVTGYTTGNSTIDDRIWRLFYADNNYAYLISDSIGNSALNNLPGFGTSTISSAGKKINKKYTQNSSWELKTDGTNINTNIQGLATLLDTTKWTDYKASYAVWALGAPSLEMFVASYNATHAIQLDCNVELNATGYKIGKSTSGGEVENYSFYVNGLGYSSDIDEAIYSPSTGSWWLSSPSANDDSNEMFVENKGSISYNYYGNSKRIRPVVAIPISKLGNGITITSKYFYKDYTVTFNADGGTASEDTRTVAEDTRIGTLPTATKIGYQFLGWFTENGEQISENTIMESQDVTYYAHWEETNLKANTTATSDGTFLGTSITRDKIKSISFATSIDAHTVDNTTCWDVSQQSNGGVLLWATGDDTNGYDVVIGQNGGVFANPSSAYLFAYIGNSINATLNLSNFDTSKVTDMEFLFYNCQNVSTLDVSGLDTSNVDDMHYMFSNCQNVGTLNVNNFNTSNVTNMGNMFQNCSTLTSIDVSHFNTSSVTNMQGMYQGCSGLTGLNLGNFDTIQVTNMSNIFDGCSSLTTLNISSFNTSIVTNMQAMFKNCNSLTTIDVEALVTNSATNMEYMFSNCSNITTLNISNFNTANVTKMNNMFHGCTNLTTIYASSNFVTTGITNSENGENMFTDAISIVGGAGTVYNASNVSYTYAHIDEGTSNPGYFTNGGYTITFDKNDASATGTMEPQTIPFNKTEKLRKNTFQKTNYSFAGWNTEPNGSGTRYTYQQEVNNLGNITLYAQWTTNKAEINGTFYSSLQNAINAVNANDPQTTIILLRDTSEKLDVAAGKNIVFDLQDFTISNNGVNPVINNYGTLAISNGTITSSTTQGAINNKSKANLIISGGSIITTGTRQAIYNEGGTIEITGDAYLSSKATVETGKNRGTVHNTSGKVTISGGTIISTDLINNGIAVSNESTMIITGGTIRSESSAGTGLYNSKTTLTIGTKDGNMLINSPIIQGKKYGLSSTADLSFYDGVIKGITSATDNDLHLKNIENDYVIAHKTETIGSDIYDVVYLKEKDTVTFDPNGGTIANGTKKVKSGDSVGTLPTATRSGYMLDGWYTSAEGGIKITEDTIINGDITFYAHWKRSYTVTFNPNGGSIIDGTKLVESGTALGDLPKATRAGFQIEGWYTSKTGGESITEDTIINGNVTYYAHWREADSAEMNGTVYNTLQQAINAAPTNGTEVTINILIDTTEFVETKPGNNIVINLQNNTLYNNGSSKVIDNYGTIKLTNGTLNSVVKLSSTIDNYASGTVIIEGVDIIATGERQAIYNNGGTVEIRGNSTISSTTTGNAPSGEPRATIQNFNGGTVTIEDGTIILDTQGSITNAAITNSANSTVILGINDGTMNISAPEIRGTTYGIINTGIIEFYDGIVKGVLGSVDGNITEVEDDYERKDDTETTNGTTYYTTYLTQINNGLLNNAVNTLSNFFSAFGQ